MGKGRLEAFSDGVIAIIITIMVLEIKVPHGSGPEALIPLIPVLLSYLLSFVFVGIYWNNHHHLLQAVHRINGAVLWANLHLLFWLSLVPFVTEWMRHDVSAPVPAAAYGVVLLLAAVSWTIMQNIVVPLQGPRAQAAARWVWGQRGRALVAAATTQRAPSSEIRMVSTFFGLNPGSMFRTRTKLLSNSPAPISRTSARANSETTSALRGRCRRNRRQAGMPFHRLEGPLMHCSRPRCPPRRQQTTGL